MVGVNFAGLYFCCIFCQNVDLIQRLEEIRDGEGTAVTKVCTYVVCVVLVSVCLVKIYLLLKVYIDCCNQIRPYLYNGSHVARA